MAILTISREFGAGGREIGLAVAAKTGYRYVDKESLLGELRKAGTKWEDWGRTLDEHCPTIWEKYDWSFRGFGALMKQMILEHASRDNAVIMGRGGNFLLRDIPFALRVRMTAPLETRIEHVMIRESLDYKTAAWLVKKTDSSRVCFVQSIYGRHWDDPADYDMVIDTSDSPHDEIADMLVKTLAHKDHLKTADSMAELSMRTLAARVQAALATDPGLNVPLLEVFAEDNCIVLRGVVHTPAEHLKLEAAAQAVTAGVRVKCELHYRA